MRKSKRTNIPGTVAVPTVLSRFDGLNCACRQVQELLMALVSRLHNPRCLQGLLEMHVEPRQIHIIQVMRVLAHAGGQPDHVSSRRTKKLMLG